MPIGNLTSQLFANVYLHELDRFMVHQQKPFGYVRYGDDIVALCRDQETALRIREATTVYLRDILHLVVHPRNDIVFKNTHGLRFFGCWTYPNGRRLQTTIRKRAENRLNLTNFSSYSGLIAANEATRYSEHFSWKLYERII